MPKIWRIIKYWLVIAKTIFLKVGSSKHSNKLFRKTLFIILYLNLETNTITFWKLSSSCASSYTWCYPEHTTFTKCYVIGMYLSVLLFSAIILYREELHILIVLNHFVFRVYNMLISPKTRQWRTYRTKGRFLLRSLTTGTFNAT